MLLMFFGTLILNLLYSDEKQVSNNLLPDVKENYTAQTQECIYKEEKSHGMESVYPQSTKPWIDFNRFYIEIFKEPNLQKRLTSLKDSPEQSNSVEVRYPIRSIRIRALPNDNWRFLQEFSLVIYLKHDPSYRVIFKLPPEAKGIDYKIYDTQSNEELLGWMSRFEPKIVHFTIGEYRPIPDLYDETFFHRRLLHTPKPENNEEDQYLDDYLWVNKEKPDF